MESYRSGHTGMVLKTAEDCLGSDVYFAKANFNVNELSLQNEEVIGAKTVSKDDMLELVSKMDYRPVQYRKHITCKILGRFVKGEESENGIYSEIHMV